MSDDNKPRNATDSSREAHDSSGKALPRPAAGTRDVPLPVTREVPAQPNTEPLPTSGISTPTPNLKVEHLTDTEPSPAGGNGRGNSYPARTTSPLDEHQKHHVAMAIVNGVPVTEIAQMTRHTPAYIRREIAEDKVIAELVDHYSGVMMRHMVAHKFAMLDRMEQAYNALDDALIDKDIRVRMQAADKVFGYADRLPGGAAGQRFEFNITPTDPEAQRQLNEATTGIRELLTKIADGELVAPPMEKHLRTNGELPGPQDVVGHESLDRN